MGVALGNRYDGTCRQVDAVVFSQFPGHPAKGGVGTEIGDHALQGERVGAAVNPGTGLKWAV